jgi:hypothetical protein
MFAVAVRNPDWWDAGPLWWIRIDCFFCFVLPSSLLLTLWITFDALRRGHNPGFWAGIVFLTSWAGLSFYLIFVRAAGNLVRCYRCRNKLLETLSTCPHCGGRPRSP